MLFPLKFCAAKQRKNHKGTLNCLSKETKMSRLTFSFCSFVAFFFFLILCGLEQQRKRTLKRFLLLCNAEVPVSLSPAPVTYFPVWFLQMLPLSRL